MLIYLLIGIAAGVASALYLYYNYQPILISGAIHTGIFASGVVVMYFAKKLTTRTASWCLVGALPVHLSIHLTITGDLGSH